eukprot:6813396-Karenia_brevis.AAC.1
MNTQAQAAFNKISGLQVRMGTEFEHQLDCEYLSRIFPWALSYSCGGPDYQNLLSNWEELNDEGYTTRSSIRSRRPPNAPKLDPGRYVQMLATRCEAQLASD